MSKLVTYCAGSIIVLIAAWGGLIFYSATQVDLLGGKTMLSDCQVMKRDKDNVMKPTNETVDIHQTNYGIKLVEATTFEGAIYGLGFVHAKDRLWQMQFYRHMARGTLAEMLGADVVPLDKYIRLMGTPRQTEHHMERISQKDLDILENYAAGVNKVVETMKVHPVEFQIMQVSFEPWTPSDSVAIQYLMTMFISSDWFFELMRERMTEIYDKEFVDELLPFKKEHYYQFKNMETITDAELERIGLYDPEHAEKNYDIDDDLLHLRKKSDKSIFEADTQGDREFTNKYESAGSGVGSNCYAVHGSKTQKGKPLLACDPHLQKVMLSLWYVTRLRWNITEGEDAERTFLVGGSLVGTPSYTYGRSPHGAFGVTALNPDVTDLFVEKLNGNQYLSNDGESWEDLTVVKDTIKVRFGSDVNFDQRFTRNGVILPRDLIDGSAQDLMLWIPKDLLKYNDLLDEENMVYSLGSIYDPIIKNKIDPDMPLDFQYTGIMELFADHTKDTEGFLQDGNKMVQEVRKVLRSPLNFVFVLTTGDIGYVMLGVFPERNHNVIHGAYTKKGWMNKNTWKGVVPNEDLPYVVNPDKNYIVSANNFVTTGHIKHGISHAFTFPHRAVRISELIEQTFANGKGGVRVEDMQRIAVDVLDIQARQSTKHMRKCVQTAYRTMNDADYKVAMVGEELLARWNYQFDVESVPASVFAAWEYEIINHMHETKINSLRVRRGLASFAPGSSFLFRKFEVWAKQHETREDYCLLHELGAKNTCQEFMGYTLIKALQLLESRLGPYKPAAKNWRYGNLVSVKLQHNPFSKSPLRSLFEISQESPGNQRTPNMIMFFQHDDENRFEVSAGSVLRIVNDLAEPTSLWVAMDSGVEQTSPWYSEHRESFIPLWEKGRYFRLPTNEMIQGIRFKTRKTGEKIRLWPGEAPLSDPDAEKPGGGCPFGFGQGKSDEDVQAEHDAFTAMFTKTPEQIKEAQLAMTKDGSHPMKGVHYTDEKTGEKKYQKFNTDEQREAYIKKKAAEDAVKAEAVTNASEDKVNNQEGGSTPDL